MKLAICSAGELFGGVERQILDLCTFLRRSGHGDPLVVLFHDRELARQLRDQGLDPVVLEGHSRYDFSLVERLTTVLTQHQISVIHTHGYKATIACALAKRRLGIKIVKTEHGKREATLARPLRWLKSQVNFGCDQYLTRRYVDQVLYVTQDIEAHYKRHHRGLKGGTVYNGIDPMDGSNYKRPADLPLDRFNVAIVGRVTPVKGIPVALAAMEHPVVPEHVHLSIIGTGPLLDRLKQQSASRGLNNRVSFLGFQKNVYDYLANIDALMMPSFHEGLPYTLLEAMSLARPVIASRVGGMAEILQDGETGILVDAGAPGQIAAALRRLVDDAELQSRLGNNAWRVQRQKLTLDAMGEQCLDYYTDPVGIGN